jgi:periplasmic protein TonB
MNACGLVATCSLLLAQVSGLSAPKTANETALLRVFRADTPGLQMPVALQTPNPRYTPEDLKARVEGAISLEVTVGVDGRVRDAMVTDGLPTFPAIEDRAFAALSEWRFQPATLNGQTVAVRTTITFTMYIR